MKDDATRSVTVGGGLTRLASGAIVGALVGATALFALLEALPPDPHALFGGTYFHLLTGGIVGGFFGLFSGVTIAWLRLVIAVGRESRQRVTGAPDEPRNERRRRRAITEQTAMATDERHSGKRRRREHEPQLHRTSANAEIRWLTCTLVLWGAIIVLGLAAVCLVWGAPSFALGPFTTRR
jgi:uncharacterized membrane protein